MSTNLDPKVEIMSAVHKAIDKGTPLPNVATMNSATRDALAADIHRNVTGHDPTYDVSSRIASATFGGARVSFETDDSLPDGAIVVS